MSSQEPTTRIPPVLYNYLPPADFAEKVLTGQSLKFTCPLNFNDPFEFRPLVRYTESPSERGHLRDLSKQRGRSSIEAKHPADHIAETYGQGVPFHNMEVYSEIVRKWGALCLTSSPKSLLMWAHYGANHTGVCLGFRTDTQPFNDAPQVQYRDAYPVMNFSATEDEEHLQNVAEALLTKSTCWSYEAEWRVLKTTTPTEPSLNQRGPGCYPFACSSIAEMIIGARCAEDFYQKAIRQTDGIPGLKIYIAEPAEREFKIELDGPWRYEPASDSLICCDERS